MSFSSSVLRPTPISTLFPYTTLFRSAVDEDPEPEDPVDDGGHPGQVADRDAYQPGEAPLVGYLVEVDAGQHAEGGHHHRHQQHHQHGTEDRRPDAAGAVGGPGPLGEEEIGRAHV